MIYPHRSLFAATLVAFAAANAFAAEVLVEPLSGDKTRGDLVGLDANAVVVRSTGSTVRWELDKVLETQILASADGDTDGEQNLGAVWLIDGSRLPFTSAESVSDDCLLDGPLQGSEGESLRVPMASVTALRLPLLADTLEADSIEATWRDLVASRPRGDLLVVRRRNGASIDSVEGVVESIGADQILFNLDGDRVAVPLSRVYGVVFFRSDEQLAAPTAEGPRIIGRHAMNVSAESIRYEAASQRLTARSTLGFEFSVPLSLTRRLDFSAGKLLWLSELPVAASRWAPWVGSQPLTLLGDAEVCYRTDQSFRTQPITLRSFDEYGLSITETYTHGLAMRSRGETVFELPPGYRSLVTRVGIDPATAASGDAVVTLLGDGEELATFGVHGQEAPIDIDVPIEGIRRLKIVVDFGRNLDTGDYVHFADARLLR
ncbi:NPCBM/NEW2 domain protein [Pseudobythopirellula maris]|uniref:NPCBM/NEW2 domain protein n=1 Tax=Pseudobythopirellula maris TaxID=2527991 RepID=A0A5C5ZSK5_9BACT|nr:NPCBM/NEW2 domain-containing protein [Pseudobythopirellula maris]TWT89967.1 NPCBM/NEW2 domain protein [Pseudobythopirellula maris]